MNLLARIAAGGRALTQGATGFATPDVTSAQKLALGQAIIAVVVVLGGDLSADDEQLVIGLSAALAAVLPLSDTLVRRNRARYATEIRDAQKDHEATTAAAATDIAPSSQERRRIVELQARLLRIDDPTEAVTGGPTH